MNLSNHQVRRGPGNRREAASEAPVSGRSIFVVSRSVAWRFFGLTAVFLVIGLVWALVSSAGLYVVLAGAAALIVTSPVIILRDYDLLSPWSLIVLCIDIGAFRSIFIALGRNGSRTIDELFLLGHPPEFFLRPGLLYLVAVALMTIGYTISRRKHLSRPAMPGPITSLRFGPYLEVAVVVFAAIGFAAFVYYAQRTGGLDPTRLSAKRATISGLQLDSNYQSYGQFRVLNLFSSIAFWAQLAKYAHLRVKHHLLTIRGLFLAALFVNACLLPLYASTRADVVFLAVIALVIHLCFSSARGARRTIAAAVVFVLVAAPVLTVLRVSAAQSNEQSATDALLTTFVYNRTFGDIPTFALIVSAVPSALPYAKGSTIVSWLFAPIPRSLWPGKPLISAGPQIGITIFGNERSGVPPGLMAESYWNFGYLGVLLIPLLVGLGLRLLHDRTAVFARISPVMSLVYAVVVVRTGIDAITNSIGYSFFSALESAALLAVFMLFACRRAARSPSDPARVGTQNTVASPAPSRRN